MTSFRPLILVLFCTCSAVAHAEEAWHWFQLQEQQLWLNKPTDWQVSQRQFEGVITAELGDGASRSGVMVWGGELGLTLDWQQLAELWRKNSADLENLQELRADSTLEDINTGLDGVDVHFQEYTGQVAGTPSRTWVGYLSHGSHGYVLMGIFPQDDIHAERQVRRVISSVRLLAPEETPTSAPSQSAESSSHEEGKITLEQEEASDFARLSLFEDEALQVPVLDPLPRDIKQLTALAALSWLEEDTRVRAELFFLDGNHCGDPFVVDEKRYRSDSPEMHFTLHRPDNTLFPSGSYRLLLVAAEQVAAIDFSLRDPTEAELLVKARAGQAEGRFGLYAYLQMEQLQDVTTSEALEWLRKAAHQGLAIAQLHLGKVYFEGLHGVEADKVLAMDWFRRAALQDDGDAAYYMARGYREGLGVPRSLGETVAWTRRAAKLGNPQSQYNLALHHLLGRGVAVDHHRALEWLRKAVAAGYLPAKDALVWLEAELAQEE